MPSAAKKAAAALRKFALSYPGAFEDFPWGEPVYKVNGKVFLFLGVDEDGLGLSAKLPETSGFALMLPFAEPTPYNLGKSGWVSATFPLDEEPPLEMLKAWIDESYRAVAPKKLAAQKPAFVYRRTRPSNAKTERKSAAPKSRRRRR